MFSRPTSVHSIILIALELALLANLLYGCFFCEVVSTYLKQDVLSYLVGLTADYFIKISLQYFAV